MANVELAGRAPSTVRTLLIADGDTVSGVIDKRSFPIVGMDITLVDAASLTFSVCDTEGGTFVTVKNSAGSSYSIGSLTAAAHALKADDLAFLAPYNYFKVIASAPQATGSTGATGKVHLMA